MTCRDIERLVRDARNARERMHEQVIHLDGFIFVIVFFINQTFRGWINKTLSKSDMDLHIDNLFSGLFDGYMLCK